MAESDSKQQKPGTPPKAPPAERPAAGTPREHDANAEPPVFDDGPAKFTVEQLLAHSRRLTGASRHVLFGALHGHDGEPLTAEEARAKVDEFRKREFPPRGAEQKENDE